MTILKLRKASIVFVSLLTIEPCFCRSCESLLSGNRNWSLVKMKSLVLSETILLSCMSPNLGRASLHLGLCSCGTHLLRTTLVLFLVLWLLLLNRWVSIGTRATIFALLLLMLIGVTLILLLIINFLGLLLAGTSRRSTSIFVTLVIALAFVLIAVATSGATIALVRVLIGRTFVVHFNLLVHFSV